MSRILGADGKPVGLAEMQRQAIAAELAVGRLALRCLAAILAEKANSKLSIPKSRIEKMREKYPGAVVRFGEEAERITLRLATPAELDEADLSVAKRDAERKETLEELAAEPAEDDGAARPAE